MTTKVPVDGPEITTWAKKTYSLGKRGQKDAWNEHDARRYEVVLGVSEEMYRHMNARESAEPVAVGVDFLLRWSNTLSDVGNEGMAWARDGDDTKPWVALMDLSASITGCLKHRAMTEAGVAVEKGSSIEDVVLTPSMPSRTRLVTDREIPRAITALVENARSELLIVSPYIWGVEKLVRVLIGSSKIVRVRIVTRRPEDGDEDHRRTMHALNHEGIEFTFSRHVHAKMIIRDREEALIGSANLVSTSLERNQEAGVLTSEEQVILDAHDYFNRVYRAARAEMIGLS